MTRVVSLYASVLLTKHLPLWGLLAMCQGVFLGLAVVWARCSGANVREMFWLRWPSARGAMAVLLLAPGVLGVQALLRRGVDASWMPGAEEFMRGIQGMMEESNRWPLPMALAVLALLPALCEEAAFRGVVMTGLSRTGSRVVAVVGSAVAFSLAHVHPAHVLIATVLGLVLGQATLRTRSIAAGVGLHLFNNAAAVLFARAGGTPAWLEGSAATVGLCALGLMLLRGLGGTSPQQAPSLPAGGGPLPNQG